MSTPTLAVLIVALSVAFTLGLAKAPIHLRIALILPAAFVAVVMLIAFVQERPAFTSGLAADVWSGAGALLGQDEKPRVAVSAGRTLPAFGGPMLAALAFSCGILAGRSRQAASTAFRSLALLGTAYAAAALCWYFYSPEYVLWWHKVSHVNDLTATFTNRNSAAIFIGFSLIVVCGRLASAISRASRRGSAVSGRKQTWANRAVFLYTVMALVCLAAILLTNSRAGTVLSLIFAALAFFLRLRRHREFSRLGVASASVLFAVPVLILIFFDTRLSDGLNDGGRLATYQATLKMIEANPVLGVGLGSYAVAFPAYRLPDAPMWGAWERAHNTLLEVGAEVGVIPAGLLVAGWIAIAWTTLKTVLRKNDTTTVTAFAIMMLGLTHSMLDFAIQIPGCGTFFYFASGIGFGRAIDRLWRKPVQADIKRSRSATLVPMQPEASAVGERPLTQLASIRSL